jgi:hypothetical protein
MPALGHSLASDEFGAKIKLDGRLNMTTAGLNVVKKPIWPAFQKADLTRCCLFLEFALVSITQQSALTSL